MLRGKERNKRKNRYAKLNRGNKEYLYTLKINCKGKRTVGKESKGINVEKIIIGLKIKNIKREREKKEENSTELQKPKVEAEICDNSKKCY